MIQEVKKDLYYFSLSMTIALSIGLFVAGVLITFGSIADEPMLNIFIYSTVLAWMITFIVYEIYQKGLQNKDSGMGK